MDKRATKNFLFNTLSRACPYKRDNFVINLEIGASLFSFGLYLKKNKGTKVNAEIRDATKEKIILNGEQKEKKPNQFTCFI